MYDMLKAALYYAERLNLKVMPLHSVTASGMCSCGNPYCDSVGKHPRTKNGSKDATRDRGTITGWWNRWPDANIGLATGRDGGLLVIDVDVDKDGDDGLRLLEDQYGPLPETWEQITGSGGRHLVFKHPDALIRNSASKLAPGVDIRGDGGYIVAAPSGHVSGRRYDWEVTHRPDEIQLALLPPEWLAALQAGNAGQRRITLPDTVNAGERNTTLYKYGCSLRSREELTEAEIYAALAALNASRCSPPLTDGELKTIADSVATLPAGRSPGFTPVSTEKDPAEEVGEAKGILSTVLAAPTIDNIYAPETIGALAALKDKDPTEYGRTREQLKKNCGVRDLDRAVNEEAKKRARWTGTTGKLRAADRYGDFPDRGILIPEGWNWNTNGVYQVVDSGDFPLACSVPVSLSKRLRDLDTGEEMIQLVFRRDGRWRNVSTKRSTAFSATKVLDLSNSGLPVSSETARTLVRFFDAQEKENLETLPVVGTVSHFGWIDGKRFLPGFGGGVELVFDETGGEAAIAEGYGVKGTLDDWKREIGDFVRRYPVPRFQLAAGFAAPLMEIIGERPFMLYVWCPSGYGKTAGALGAVSIWGDAHKLMTTFNSTLVGLEWTAALYRDLPVLIDERQTVEQGDRGDERLKAILYMLGEGKAKTRGKRGGGLQRSSVWRSVALGTGEHALLSSSAPAGARNRILELYAKPFPDETKEEAGKLHTLTSTFYGTAGHAFMEQLLKTDRKAVTELFTGCLDSFSKQFGQHSPPHIREVSLLCTADVLASQWLFDESLDEALLDAYGLGAEIFAMLEAETSGSDAERAMEYFRSWFGSSRAMFDTDPPGGKRYGFAEGAEIHVYPTVFDAAMREGRFDPLRVKKDWAELGWIETSSEGDKVRMTIQKRHGDTKDRFIVIRKTEDYQTCV